MKLRAWRIGRARGTALFAGLLLLPVLLAAWGPLYNETDGQYAAAARTMAIGGSWLVPENNGVPRLVKPPLLTWLMAAAMKLFGPHEFAARLPGALAMSATGLAIYGLGAAWGTRRRGMLAAIIWLTLLGNFTLGRIVMPEPIFTAGIALSILCFVRAAQTDGSSRKLAILGFWLFGGLAAFAKGPHGLLIPLAASLAALASHAVGTGRRAMRWGEMFPVVGILLALAINLPWYAAMEWRFPGFLRNLIFAEYGGHILGSDAPATGRGNVAVPAFLALHLAWFFPWSAALIGARWRVLRNFQPPRRWSLPAWAIIWAAGLVVVPVLLAGQRQDYYAMAAWPFLALLAARCLEGANWNRACGAVAACLALAVFAVSFAAWAAASAPSLSLDQRATALSTLASLDRNTWIQLLGVTLAACFAGVALLAFMLPRWQGIALAGACLAVAACAGTAIVSPLFSAKGFAALAARLAGPEGRILFDGDVDSASSLLFYTGRRIFLIDVEPDRDFVVRTTGLGRPNYLTRSEVVDLWRKPSPIVLICDKSQLPDWECRLEETLEPVAAAGTTIVLANPMAAERLIYSH